MGSAINWQCPFCARHVTITDERRSSDTHTIGMESRHGRQLLSTTAVACPNPECKELYITASLKKSTFDGKSNRWIDASKPHSSWTLRPQGTAKPFPEYVPAAILSDYREACLIRELSPKASATLSRRCLQGMIRDFWNIRKNRLIDEIEALEDKVDAPTWGAIDAVRKIGNIGAHMEKDVDVIVDVEPREAELLTQLIETLLQEWYVQRHER